ncbi:MAG: hypothetical protein Hyperionvirus7_13 [Hyperionvirus sp.]|uniref:Uncharacterized protein n=1 Tax=Hyperionvirus sp. TaxID=2487770 RepID=A0A3G5A8P8_9VIRU|nr:MAG: hypothetical protein Hyperionvirus7_13 [Hyperionvirus sp.]
MGNSKSVISGEKFNKKCPEKTFVIVISDEKRGGPAGFFDSMDHLIGLISFTKKNHPDKNILLGFYQTVAIPDDAVVTVEKGVYYSSKFVFGAIKPISELDLWSVKACNNLLCFAIRADYRYITYVRDRDVMYTILERYPTCIKFVKEIDDNIRKISVTHYDGELAKIENQTFAICLASVMKFPITASDIQYDRIVLNEDSASNNIVTKQQFMKYMVEKAIIRQITLTSRTAMESVYLEPEYTD